MNQRFGENAPPRLLPAILWGGLTVGVLDYLDATVFYGLAYKVPPIRIPQSIASGLLGRSAYQGGVATAALGVALHFFIATVMAAVYVGASRKLPALLRRPVPWGMAYGIACYFVMNYIVLPLSAVYPKGGFSLGPFLNGVIGHALLVGLPIALIASRHLGPVGPAPGAPRRPA